MDGYRYSFSSIVIYQVLNSGRADRGVIQEAEHCISSLVSISSSVDRRDFDLP
jgi:hypothetical protein